jgi:hypothetical protein
MATALALATQSVTALNTLLASYQLNADVIGALVGHRTYFEAVVAAEGEGYTEAEVSAAATDTVDDLVARQVNAGTIAFLFAAKAATPPPGRSFNSIQQIARHNLGTEFTSPIVFSAPAAGPVGPAVYACAVAAREFAAGAEPADDPTLEGLGGAWSLVIYQHVPATLAGAPSLVLAVFKCVDYVPDDLSPMTVTWGAWENGATGFGSSGVIVLDGLDVSAQVDPQSVGYGGLTDLAEVTFADAPATGSGALFFDLNSLGASHNLGFALADESINLGGEDPTILSGLAFTTGIYANCPTGSAAPVHEGTWGSAQRVLVGVEVEAPSL